jgi:hypothetical protein
LEDANKVFLKGAKGGLKATDEIYDLMIEEDCKVGDHSNALEIAYEMEAAGRMATTFHFNCLLSVQVTLSKMLLMRCLFLHGHLNNLLQTGFFHVNKLGNEILYKFFMAIVD